MQPFQEHLIVFTRYPRPGSTKTRLIPVLGARGAAELQRQMTEHLVAVLRQPALRQRIRSQIRYDGGDADRMRRWLGGEFQYRPQGGGDLAKRMQRALQASFRDGAEFAVLIGCDIPHISAPLLERAFAGLRRHDLVLGPASDGGYYLVGLNRRSQPRALPGIFEDIPWGTERVLVTTLEKACLLGLDFQLLEELTDVDRPEDLPVWRKIASRISVVIPTLNEAGNIGTCLQRVRTGRNVEAIVVDGGSRDDTADVARTAGVRLLKSRPPRAAQMNAGAAAATGEILLFLHADCRLPDDYDEQVRQVLGHPGVSAGAFRLAIDSRRASMRIMERVANLRAHFLRKPYGDQALFISARIFHRIGGFSEMAIMEDYELVQRLSRRGRIQLAAVPVQTSPRRWQHVGVWKTWWLNQLVIAGYHMGASPRTLARIYRKPTRKGR
ncbi:MAG TPA: TIGR04283 family arsenosugar biosynthesis glycosyltransferase [Desulfobacterales bacterium]